MPKHKKSTLPKENLRMANVPGLVRWHVLFLDLRIRIISDIRIILLQAGWMHTIGSYRGTFKKRKRIFVEILGGDDAMVIRNFLCFHRRIDNNDG